MFRGKSMSCESCNTKFTILKRRKTCLDCSYEYCIDCVVRNKVFDRKYQCIRCKIFKAVPIDPNAVMQLKVKDLRWFLASKSVPIVGCKEKTELVDLIMQYSSLSSAHAAYPQNFKHHTVIPELLNCKNVDHKKSPSLTPDISNHSPGPSGAEYIPHTSGGDFIPQTSGGVFIPQTSGGVFIPQTSGGVFIPQTSGGVFIPQTSGGEYIPPALGGESIPPTLGGENIPPTLGGENITPTLGGENLPQVSQIVDPSIEIPIESRSLDSDIHSHEQTSGAKKDNGITKDYQTMSIDSLNSIEDISALSVMQLKVLLTRNFVAYQGCREKSELQEKVRWLWKQKQAAKEIETVPDENLCKICMEAAIDSVLLDCGHMMTCTQCGKQLHECPICRQIIVRVVHIFKS